MADGKDWARENALGRERADTLVHEMREIGAPMMLGRFVQDMGDANRDLDGFHVGFFHRIAELAMQAASPD